MELVTNGNQWAVKKGWCVWSKYLNLNVPYHWHSYHNYFWYDGRCSFIEYCWGTKERAEECMGYYKHKKVKL